MSVIVTHFLLIFSICNDGIYVSRSVNKTFPAAIAAKFWFDNQSYCIHEVDVIPLNKISTEGFDLEEFRLLDNREHILSKDQICMCKMCHE